jgi:hypothetical protein
MNETSSIVTGRRPALPIVTLNTGSGGDPCRMMYEFRATRICTDGSSRAICCIATIVETTAAYAASPFDSWRTRLAPGLLHLPQHPDEHRPKDPVLLRSRSGARRRRDSPGSPRTLRSGRLVRGRGASGRGAARRGEAGPRASRRSRSRRSSSSGRTVGDYVTAERGIRRSHFGSQSDRPARFQVVPTLPVVTC